MNNRLAVDIILDLHGFSFDTERLFRGITISEAPDGWNCVIRATEKSGAPVYAMTKADDPQEGIMRLYKALSLGNGDVLWRHDRFAKERAGS